MRYWIWLCFPIFIFLFPVASSAQQKDSVSRASKPDSASTLQEVIVSAFSLQSRWEDAPAAVAVVNQKQLQLLNNGSLVPIFNTVAGVRMEERSPGSYRLSIRGSLLRSPFGVRNVKVYWNDIPLTDGGGNTYLQLVDISQLQSAEIIKGPASSLYGANTGGAVILHSGNYTAKNAASVSLSGGSYGLFNESASYSHASNNFQTGIQQTHQQSDGYRDQSALRRDVIKWDGNWQLSSKEKLNFLAFYSDLYYQTPGGITFNQLYSDTTAYPRAIVQQNAVYNKTIFGGVSLTSSFSRHFNNITTITANHTAFKNPFTTNYELRDENNIGGRTAFSYHAEGKRITFKWLAGAEWLHNHSYIDDYDNDSGRKGNVQFQDELYATQYVVFTQANVELNQRFTLQAGFSDNQQIIRYRRPADPALHNFQKSRTNHLLAPRFSALFKIINNINVYTVAAKGFSPPTLAELHPSNGTFNDTLQTEYGWNYEAGIKGSALNNRLLFDASVYSFGLRDAIVRRSSDAVSEYYVNAGKTKQRGIEAWFKAYIIRSQSSFITSLSVANSFAYQPYRFTSYKVDNSDYSGNRITGVPRTINVTTVEAGSKTGIYTNVIFNTVSAISLNDAASAYARSYHLLQSKIGYQNNGRFRYNLFIGGDNLFNETYSLGNDINAFGGRYYNPAPKRNYLVGLQVGI